MRCGWKGILFSLGLHNDIGYRVIYGFITKEESLEKLKSASEGTFIIRFSESNPGAFAIACTSSDPKDRVKHFLVKPDDLGNGA